MVYQKYLPSGSYVYTWGLQNIVIQIQKGILLFNVVASYVRTRFLIVSLYSYVAMACILVK